MIYLIIDLLGEIHDTVYAIHLFWNLGDTANKTIVKGHCQSIIIYTFSLKLNVCVRGVEGEKLEKYCFCHSYSSHLHSKCHMSLDIFFGKL